ncbi:hypothetical protein [Bacillus marasmi]|uniref:hypothetical protein n=1 Tax=Bacillus marasmi TaxID=1926279 RepID=UPI001FEBAEC3|nr:hypothetical protein [Bacillus marasmi]
MIWYRYNLKKAVELSKDAIFPQEKEDFTKLLIPAEWKEMQPLTTNSKPYQSVKWGTVAVIILSAILLWYVLTTNWLETAFLNIIYLFSIGIRFIHHPGNFYILQNGIVLNGRYYSFNQVKNYQVEKIIRWHELYGLSSRVDNAYKLTLGVQTFTRQPHYIVVENEEMLKRITSLLQHKNVPSKEPIQNK